MARVTAPPPQGLRTVALTVLSLTLCAGIGAWASGNIRPMAFVGPGSYAPNGCVTVQDCADECPNSSATICEQGSCNCGYAFPPGGACGNGVIDAGEQCDGANMNGVTTCPEAMGAPYVLGTPHCANTCTYDGCSMISAPACGDGVVGQGEDCDDGNTADHDGCSASCRTEATDACASVCAQAPAQGFLPWLLQWMQQSQCGCAQQQGACGDGTVQQARGETCDDGNAADNDGCSAACSSENRPDGTRCGDGTIDDLHGEQCDKGTANAAPGCPTCAEAAGCTFDCRLPPCAAEPENVAYGPLLGKLTNIFAQVPGGGKPCDDKKKAGACCFPPNSTYGAIPLAAMSCITDYGRMTKGKCMYKGKEMPFFPAEDTKANALTKAANACMDACTFTYSLCDFFEGNMVSSFWSGGKEIKFVVDRANPVPARFMEKLAALPAAEQRRFLPITTNPAKCKKTLSEVFCCTNAAALPRCIEGKANVAAGLGKMCAGVANKRFDGGFTDKALCEDACDPTKIPRFVCDPKAGKDEGPTCTLQAVKKTDEKNPLYFTTEALCSASDKCKRAVHCLDVSQVKAFGEKPACKEMAYGASAFANLQTCPQPAYTGTPYFTKAACEEEAKRIKAYCLERRYGLCTPLYNAPAAVGCDAAGDTFPVVGNGEDAERAALDACRASYESSRCRNLGEVCGQTADCCATSGMSNRPTLAECAPGGAGKNVCKAGEGAACSGTDECIGGFACRPGQISNFGASGYVCRKSIPGGICMDDRECGTAGSGWKCIVRDGGQRGCWKTCTGNNECTDTLGTLTQKCEDGYCTWK